MKKTEKVIEVLNDLIRINKATGSKDMKKRQTKKKRRTPSFGIYFTTWPRKAGHL